MGSACKKYSLDFEFQKLDVSFGEDKRIYQILDDKGMIFKSIVIPIFYNTSGNLDDAETFDGLYPFNESEFKRG